MPDDIRTEDDLRARAETFETAFDEVTEMLGAVRAERDAAWAAIRALHAGLEEHPVCVHGPEYDEQRWQNGCSFCPLVRPLFDLVPGLVEGA